MTLITPSHRCSKKNVIYYVILLWLDSFLLKEFVFNKLDSAVESWRDYHFNTTNNHENISTNTAIIIDDIKVTALSQEISTLHDTSKNTTTNHNNAMLFDSVFLGKIVMIDEKDNTTTISRMKKQDNIKEGTATASTIKMNNDRDNILISSPKKTVENEIETDVDPVLSWFVLVSLIKLCVLVFQLLIMRIVIGTFLIQLSSSPSSSSSLGAYTWFIDEPKRFFFYCYVYFVQAMSGALFWWYYGLSNVIGWMFTDIVMILEYKNIILTNDNKSNIININNRDGNRNNSDGNHDSVSPSCTASVAMKEAFRKSKEISDCGKWLIIRTKILQVVILSLMSKGIEFLLMKHNNNNNNNNNGNVFLHFLVHIITVYAGSIRYAIDNTLHVVNYFLYQELSIRRKTTTTTTTTTKSKIKTK